MASFPRKPRRWRVYHPLRYGRFYGAHSPRSRRNAWALLTANLIENTAQFTGTYHVLGGLISPVNGVGPSDLNIDSLIQRIKEEQTTEVIMALSATMEGDTTVFYLSRKLKDMGVTISTISRGIAVGGELEYADEITLVRSIALRVPYQGT